MKTESKRTLTVEELSKFIQDIPGNTKVMIKVDLVITNVTEMEYQGLKEKEILLLQ